MNLSGHINILNIFIHINTLFLASIFRIVMEMVNLRSTCDMNTFFKDVEYTVVYEGIFYCMIEFWNMLWYRSIWWRYGYVIQFKYVPKKPSICKYVKQQWSTWWFILYRWNMFIFSMITFSTTYMHKTKIGLWYVKSFRRLERNVHYLTITSY